jgi:hypothetical protein
MLLGVMLNKAGLKFISAKARHRAGGMRIDEIVVATSEDLLLVEAWMIKEGFPAMVRVATAEEMKEFEERC